MCMQIIYIRLIKINVEPKNNTPEFKIDTTSSDLK